MVVGAVLLGVARGGHGGNCGLLLAHEVMHHGGRGGSLLLLLLGNLEGIDTLIDQLQNYKGIKTKRARSEFEDFRFMSACIKTQETWQK